MEMASFTLYGIGINGKNIPISNNANYTSQTYKNLDLKTIIGHDNYNKYKQFNLILNEITQSDNGFNSDSSDVLNCEVKISGLPFVHSSYDFLQQTRVSEASLAFCQILGGYLTIFTQYSNNILTFAKVPNCDLTINYYSISTNALANLSATADNNLTGFRYLFNIVGVEGSEED